MSNPTGDPGHVPPDAESDANQTAASLDSQLPPLQPPSAGCLQLFFIPLVIVAILVGVWFLFSRLAHMGSDPTSLVEDFEQVHTPNWQKAFTLAHVLRDPSHEALRRDAELARRVAAILDRETDTETDTEADAEQQIAFRRWLAKALGEFHVPDGLPALLRAGDQAESLDEWPVRRAALEAIARLIDRLGAKPIEQNQNLLPVLNQVARQRGQTSQQRQARAKLRALAAFVLGLLESDASRHALVPLLSDPNPLVQYNAAAALARRGDPRSLPLLLKMLQPDNPQWRAATGGEIVADAAESESESVESVWNQMHVISNALRAATQLARQNPSADLSPLEPAVLRLLQSDLPDQVRAEAENLTSLLDQRRPDL